MELVKRMEMRETGWIKISKSVLRFLGREHSLKKKYKILIKPCFFGLLGQERTFERNKIAQQLPGSL